MEGAGVGSPNGLENRGDSVGQEFDALTFFHFWEKTMKKYIMAALAALTLTGVSTPATADAQRVRGEISISIGDRSYRDDYRRPGYYYPRCYRNERLVRDRYGRLRCVHIRDLRRRHQRDRYDQFYYHR
jgi:hypothetical protein